MRRILIPLAQGAARAVGLDIAQAMLDEAARNCAERAAQAELLRAEEIEGLQGGSISFIPRWCSSTCRSARASGSLGAWRHC